MIVSVRQTILGAITISECDGALTNLYFEHYAVPEDAEPGESEVIREAFRQLLAYLGGKLRVFDLPLSPLGTPFMQEVWHHVAGVSFGRTATYRDIAAAIGNPRAVRAVGMANHRNPLPLFIPCHRIIGSDGSLTGYRGGLQLKRRLLAMERLSCASDFVGH